MSENANEALELEVERAYVELDRIGARRRTLWLTTGCFRLIWDQHQPNGTVEVGTYRLSVRLADLRDDVFHVYEALTRRGHRATS